MGAIINFRCEPMAAYDWTGPHDVAHYSVTVMPVHGATSRAL